MSTSPAPARSSRLYAPLIGATTLGVLLQAVTAGLFMALRGSGGEGWVGAHDLIANITVVAALASAIVAVVAFRRSRPAVMWGTIVLAALMILQTLIGHLMADAKVGGMTAVHVPLAMIVFGLAIWLSVRTARTARA